MTVKSVAVAIGLMVSQKAVLEIATAHSPSLVALRTYDKGEDGLSLPPEFLSNLGPIPPKLQYLRWDVGEEPATYLVEQCEGKNVATKLDSMPCVQDDVQWTAESILPHVRF